MSNFNFTSKEKAPSNTPTETMHMTLRNYGLNPLHLFLVGKFDKEKVDNAYTLYNVGTASYGGGATVFWQVDIDGQVRGGKVMVYDSATGHRSHAKGASWAHSLMKTPDYHLKQCLFGEHLLTANPYKPVALVESEKTCLIGHILMPDMLWLATGGKAGCFNQEACRVLEGRDVLVIPDLGAMDDWRKKTNLILKPICKSVKIYEDLERIATPEQRAAGLDIADFLLEEFDSKGQPIGEPGQPSGPYPPPADMTDRVAFDWLKAHRPDFAKFVDGLGLELVDCHTG